MSIHAWNDNTKCRAHYVSNKMGEDGGLRTVESLRGRLLAERQASRTAKQEAEFMSKKIEELEAHLKEEIKLREKAEKRLRFLMKKFESLKGSCSLEGSELSSSIFSEVSAVSCVSSTGTSASKEEDEEAKTQITSSDKTHDRDLRDDTKPDQVTADLPSVEESSSSKLENLYSGNATVASTTSHEEPKTGDSSPTKTSSREKMIQVTETDKDDEIEDGNSWALVPVEMALSERDNKDAEIEDKNVVEVLNALRHAREKVQRLLKEKRACDVTPQDSYSI